MNKIIYTISLLLISLQLFAQPANNVCSGAASIPTNGTCITGTTAGATDNWIGTVGCAGNNAEVWYTFTATGTQTEITVTNGTAGGNAEIILVEASAPCDGLLIRGSSCGPSPRTATITGLQVGTLYYITVSFSGAAGTFTICNTVSTPPPTPGLDCPSAAPLCDGSSFSQGVFSGVGAVENISTNTCFGGNERQSKWYTFTVGADGTFEFVITPSNLDNDYDWALWNTSTGCYSSGSTMGTAIRCNWSGCQGATGIHPNPASVPGARNTNGGGPSGCGGTYAAFNTSPPTLVAGQTYTLLVDNFSSSGTGFDISFGGTAVIGPNANFATTLDASCQTISFNRLGNYTGANMTYLWNFGNGTTSTSAVPSPHTYGTTGNFTVSLQVTDANGCVEVFSQTIDVGCLLSTELSKFEGKSVQGKYNALEWITTSEENTDYFILERSVEVGEWDKIAVVNAAGNSQELRSYSHNDYGFISRSVNYYRLRQVKIDGTFEFSNAIAVDNSKDTRRDKEIFKVVNQLGQITELDAPGLKIVIFTDGSSEMRINTVER
jgi:PKD repeat protein